MRFLGNKTRMLENIQFVIDDNNINGEVFCDLFAGSGSVGDYFKDRFKILSNDYLYSLSIINKAKLSNAKMPQFTTFIETDIRLLEFPGIKKSPNYKGFELSSITW